MKRFLKPVFASLLCLAASALNLAAQSITASAQLSSQPGTGGNFNYTISLDNSAASSSSIGVFWYAWTPGQNYLPSNPSLVTPPTGWTDTITHGGAGDGYGIQFTASSAANAIAPGQFLDFNFETLDTPAELAGHSPYYPGTPVGTSYAYGPGFTPSVQFEVASVPEPSALGLLLLGSLGLLLAKSKRFFGLIH